MTRQDHFSRKLAWFSLAFAASSVPMFVIGESFFWRRPTLFAYEGVMDAGAGLMALSAICGMAAFVRAGQSGAVRPALVKWMFAVSTLFGAALVFLLVSIVGMPLSA